MFAALISSFSTSSVFVAPLITPSSAACAVVGLQIRSVPAVGVYVAET